MKFNSTKNKLSLSLAALLLVSSTNITHANESLKQLEQQKEQLQKNAQTSESITNELENKLDKIEGDIHKVEQEMINLEQEIASTNHAIEEKEHVILKTEKEIKEIELIIEQKTSELNDKQALLEEHLKIMYSGGKVELLEVLFRSDSLSQFINRYEYYKDISKKGESLHSEIVAEISFIEQQKEALENKKTSLEKDKLELETHKQNQNQQKLKKEALQAHLGTHKKHVEEDLHEQEEALNFLAISIAQTEKEIKSEKSRIEIARKKAEEERKQREKELREQQKNKNINSKKTRAVQSSPSKGSGTRTVQSSPSQGSGILGSPLSKGTYYISSHYGYRTHPVSGLKNVLHGGTDYAAPLNTPIYAVGDGYVMFSGATRGFGNWIVIKHDNGLYSIYGHMYSNQLYAKAGQYVFKGQHIGGVGSAGTSTGNHLHLAIANSYIGSKFNYVDSRNYIR